MSRLGWIGWLAGWLHAFENAACLGLPTDIEDMMALYAVHFPTMSTNLIRDRATRSALSNGDAMTAPSAAAGVGAPGTRCLRCRESEGSRVDQEVTTEASQLPEPRSMATAHHIVWFAWPFGKKRPISSTRCENPLGQLSLTSSSAYKVPYPRKHLLVIEEGVCRSMVRRMKKYGQRLSTVSLGWSGLPSSTVNRLQ